MVCVSEISESMAVRINMCTKIAVVVQAIAADSQLH